MDLVRADPDLSPKSKPHPVRHTRAGVPEHAGGIDTALKLLRDAGGGGEDGVGLVRIVGIDVGYCEGAGC